MEPNCWSRRSRSILLSYGRRRRLGVAMVGIAIGGVDAVEAGTAAEALAETRKMLMTRDHQRPRSQT